MGNQTQAARLDRIYFSQDLLPRVQSIDVLASVDASDHKPLVISFSGPVNLGPSRFILNNKLIQKEELKSRTETILQECQEALKGHRPSFEVYLAHIKRVRQLYRTNGTRLASDISSIHTNSHTCR